MYLPIGQTMRLTLAVLLFAMLAFALSGCESRPPAPVKLSGETMGTTYNIVVVDVGDNKLPALEAAVAEALTTVNEQMSNWDPNSEVSRLNDNQTTEPVRLSTELASVISAAGTVHSKSEGLFDITLSPLIELWGFGREGGDKAVPADELITEALQRVGHDKLLRVDTTVPALSKVHSEVTVNLSAIAKGYGIDVVAKKLDSLGISHYMVEIGGDLFTKGNNAKGESWVIGIEKPEPGARAVYRKVSVSNRGMATSGDYRNAFQDNGQRYSHIIDPTNGRPIDHNTASATVLTDSAMMADAWATAMLVLGSKKGMLIAEREQVAVQFIDRDGEGFAQMESEMFRQYVQGTQVASQ